MSEFNNKINIGFDDEHSVLFGTSGLGTYLQKSTEMIQAYDWSLRFNVIVNIVQNHLESDLETGFDKSKMILY